MIQRKAIRLQGWDYSRPGGYFITVCTKDRKAIFGTAPSPTNSTVAKWVSLWKRFCNRCNGEPLFQRGYYDHIIRDQADFDRILECIHTNPAKWIEDVYYTT